MADIRTITTRDEAELLHDAQWHVICERCGGILEPWSPVEGATWWECQECGCLEATGD